MFNFKPFGERGTGRYGTADNFLYSGVTAAMLAVLFLSVSIFVSFNYAQKEVKLLVDGKQSYVRTFADDVDGLLQEQNLILAEKDKVQPSSGTRLKDDMVVAVIRAVPVSLRVGENEVKMVTASRTVGEVLKEKQLVLGERDTVTPGVATAVKPGMQIQVDRIITKVIEEDVPIPYQIVRQNDNDLKMGIVKVVQPGSKGLLRKKWELTFKNGKETEKRLLAGNIIKDPVDRVVRVGSMQTVSRGGNEIRYSRVINMVATAYTHTGNNTSTGIRPHVGVVAVDPSVIPMGTRLYVEGYGYCRAMDRGSKIRGNRIDVFMNTQSQALSWGIKRVNVYLID